MLQLRLDSSVQRLALTMPASISKRKLTIQFQWQDWDGTQLQKAYTERRSISSLILRSKRRNHKTSFFTCQ